MKICDIESTWTKINDTVAEATKTLQKSERRYKITGFNLSRCYQEQRTIQNVNVTGCYTGKYSNI